MAKNALLDEIRKAFIALEGSTSDDILREFCAFGNSWLQKNNVVGVGQTVDGFSIRLADGAEYLLTAAPASAETDSAVSISGLTGRGDRVTINNSNVQITGN